VKSRAAWGSEDYARVTGRDNETLEVLRTKVLRGAMSVDAARQSMTDQGFDPDLLGQPSDDMVLQVIRARIAKGDLTIDDGRKTAENLGFDPDKVGKAVK